MKIQNNFQFITAQSFPFQLALSLFTQTWTFLFHSLAFGLQIADVHAQRHTLRKLEQDCGMRCTFPIFAHKSILEQGFWVQFFPTLNAPDQLIVMFFMSWIRLGKTVQGSVSTGLKFEELLI